jgi:hypothetical protein
MTISIRNVSRTALIGFAFSQVLTAAFAQQPPPRPQLPGGLSPGNLQNTIDNSMNQMLRQQRGDIWDFRQGGTTPLIEGFVIWEDSNGYAPRPDGYWETEEGRRQAREYDRIDREEHDRRRTPREATDLQGGSRPADPLRPNNLPPRPPGGAGTPGGQSNLVSGGGRPALPPINLPRVIRRDRTASVVSTNGFRSVLFTPIYQNSTVYQTATFYPSSAGASGFDAVPWISRWGNGVSSAGTSLSSLGGEGSRNIDYRTNTGIFQQVTLLRNQGRFNDAQALLDRTAPGQFGGTFGATENTAFYMGLIQAFIGGDTQRLTVIYNSDAVLQALGGYTGLSSTELRQRLADLNGGDLFRGAADLNRDAFIRTTAGDLIGVGGMGLIRGQLIWTTTADLDLHMYIPGGSPTQGGTGHVYYGTRTVTFNGGGGLAQLDRDNLGGVIDAAPNRRVENIVVTGATIPPGGYSFFVYNFNSNGNLTTNYTLTLTGNGGATTRTVTGTLTNNQQSPTTVVTSPGGKF